MNCSPATLANAARCFKTCSGQGNLQAIKNYLVCKAYNAGGLKPGGGGGPTDPVAADWAARVVTNGGAAPSANTVAAVSTFAVSMRSAGIDSKMISVCCFVPDGLVAAITPIYKTAGNDPWTNHSFVTPNDLNVNGLKGDGSLKYLDTGVVPSTMWPSGTATQEAGLTVYCPESNTANQCELGSLADSNNIIALYECYGDNMFYYQCYGASNGLTMLVLPSNAFQGFFSGSRNSPTSFSFYKANGVVPFTNMATGTGGPSNGITNPYTIYAFAYRSGGAPAALSSKRMSFAAIHYGLTATETQALFNAVTALRVSLGGGYYPLPPVQDWASRVMNNGGPAPSAGTVSAMTTFVNSLQSAGIWNKMLSVNCIVPDSLIAACTPLIKGTGVDPWVNNNFVSGDLTVNGLKGNASNKYLNTGFSAGATWPPGTITPQAGVSIYFTSNDNTFSYDFGVDAGDQADLEIGVYSGGSFYFVCYGYTVGVDEVTGGPSTGWTGFLSGNRTSPTVLALYGANSSIGFTTIGGFTSATARNGMYYNYSNAAYLFAADNSNSPYYPSGKTISFCAIHNGLTATEAQALYNAVQALRVALGGGYV